MKYVSHVVCTTFVGVFILTGCLCYADDLRKSANQDEYKKSVVLRYFHEVLDGKQYGRMNELFTNDIVMHRPDGVLSDLPFIQSIFETGLSPHTFKTTIHDIINAGDRVVVRLSHRMTFSAKHAFLRSRIGTHDVRGKTIEWDAMAIFRFYKGKIAEEWVSFDELGKLMQIGRLKLSDK